MKKRKVGIVVAVLLIIAAVIVWRTYFQKKGDEGVLLLSGNMEVTETNVGFKLAGRVVELAVDEGQRVEKDRILARLDNAELASAVTQNRAALQESISRLAELKSGSRPQEIEQAKANVRSQEAELARLTKDFERAETLYRNGAISACPVRRGQERVRDADRASEERLGIAEPRQGRAEKGEHRCSRVPGGAGKGGREDLRRETEGYGYLCAGPRDHTEKERRARGNGGSGRPGLHHRGPRQPWIKVYVTEDKLGLVKLGQKALVSADTLQREDLRRLGELHLVGSGVHAEERPDPGGAGEARLRGEGAGPESEPGTEAQHARRCDRYCLK